MTSEEKQKERESFNNRYKNGMRIGSVHDDISDKLFSEKEFEFQKEEVMEIKGWKELDGKEINGYVFDIGSLWVKIRLSDTKTHVLTLWFEAMSDEVMIEHLKLHGIEVEFEKPMTITQEEHDFLQWLYTRNKNATISRKGTSRNWQSGCIEWAGTYSYFSEFNVGMEHPVSDLLKCRIEG